jgi:hypothetical protein
MMWRTGQRVLLSSALAAVVVGCGASEDPPAAGSNAYSGWEQRGVASLSDEDIDELLSGAGHGYALPAELNDHPGPAHAIDLASELGIDTDQLAEVERIEAVMLERAQELGGLLVDAEWHLDEAFRAGTDPDEVAELTQRSAAIEAELRSVHLEAHLETTQLLSADQIARYNELRGYASGEMQDDHDSRGDHRDH